MFFRGNLGFLKVFPWNRNFSRIKNNVAAPSQRGKQLSKGACFHLNAVPGKSGSLQIMKKSFNDLNADILYRWVVSVRAKLTRVPLVSSGGLQLFAQSAELTKNERDSVAQQHRNTSAISRRCDKCICKYGFHPMAVWKAVRR